jgi:hypothetical protein
VSPPLRPKGMSDEQWHAMLASIQHPEITAHTMLTKAGRPWASAGIEASSVSIGFDDPEGVVEVKLGPSQSASSPQVSWARIRATWHKKIPVLELSFSTRSQTHRTLFLPAQVQEHTELRSESGAHYATLTVTPSRITFADADGQERIVLSAAPGPGTRFTAPLEGFVVSGFDCEAPAGPTQILLIP